MAKLLFVTAATTTRTKKNAFPDNQKEVILTVVAVDETPGKKVNRRFVFNKHAATTENVKNGKIFKINDDANNVIFGFQSAQSDMFISKYLEVGGNLAFANKEIYEELKAKFNFDSSKENYLKLELVTEIYEGMTAETQPKLYKVTGLVENPNPEETVDVDEDDSEEDKEELGKKILAEVQGEVESVGEDADVTVDNNEGDLADEEVIAEETL